MTQFCISLDPMKILNQKIFSVFPIILPSRYIHLSVVNRLKHLQMSLFKIAKEGINTTSNILFKVINKIIRLTPFHFTDSNLLLNLKHISKLSGGSYYWLWIGICLLGSEHLFREDTVEVEHGCACCEIVCHSWSKMLKS